MTSIVWFRTDLRLADNPALHHALRQGDIIPVYIRDDTSIARKPGGASQWWLHHSLEHLRKRLGALVLLHGDITEQLLELSEKSGAQAIYWNRCYEPDTIARDREVKKALAEQGLDVRSFNSALLNEPWQVQTKAGGPFKVYSPFWRACRAQDFIPPLPQPKIKLAAIPNLGDDLDDWCLLPQTPNWASGWNHHWTPGEAGAQAQLDAFCAHGLSGYASGRDHPDRANVSRLSPHLHFGEISPRQIWSKLKFLADANPELQSDVDKFAAELGWREFSYHLLYHFPDLPQQNWKSAFDAYPWRECDTDLQAWQKGMTGYPIVDAGMRELWQTGYMHNRVRMIAASFLIKHLRIHWQHGEAWFWDTLVDADLANNVSGWQWVAGSGADAAPYFRIFNPILQGEKFDPEGDYVLRWCPELSALDRKYLHRPFEAPTSTLEAADIHLGKTYPRPIVDHKAAREAALAGYNAMKDAAKTKK